MKNPSQQKWDAIYQLRATEAHSPAQVLSEHTYLLPRSGLALDLACGLGGNAFFLADKGLKVDAWDISPVAIDKIKQQLPNDNSINAVSHDITRVLIPPNYYDVIIVSRFLDRTIIPNIIDALKPQGLLFYQTFIRNKTSAVGPTNPEFLLANNELLKLCASLSVVFYREEGQIGATEQGFRNEAMYIGQKQSR
ncbi:MAG: SAM-dependent methyltransferase [Cycloclasticus sp.]|nr:MAG: SAM-dependent methyltransferase [Cycloclasticus sp.]